MSRVFSSGVIVLDEGTLDATPNGALTIAVVFKRSGSTTDGTQILVSLDAGVNSNQRVGVSYSSASALQLTIGGISRTFGASFTISNDTWYLFVVRKASGTATPSANLYSYAAASWVGWTNGSGTLDNDANTIVEVRLGNGPGDFPLNGKMMGAVIYNTALSDADGETLETAAQNWLDLSPVAMWRPSETNPVVDDTGNGADETSSSGTSDDGADDPAGFDPDLGGGTQTIDAAFIAATGATFAPALSSVATIAASFLASGATVFAPALTPGPVVIDAGFIASITQVFPPALSTGETVIEADFIAATSQTFAPAVTSATTIDASFIASASVVHDPTLTSLATIEAPFIASTATVYPPALLSGDEQLIEASFIASTATVYKPRIYGGGKLAPLASVDDIETILGRELTAAEQAQALMFLEMASDFVRDYTGRSFEYQSNHEIRIQSDAHGIIDLPDPPIHDVATVLNAEDDVEVDGWLWDQMWRLRCIPAWLTCKVTYTHGYVDVPAVITHVVASMASRQVINPAGIRQETVGSISVTYASVFGEAGALGLSGMERQVLERYRDTHGSWRI